MKTLIPVSPDDPNICYVFEDKTQPPIGVAEVKRTPDGKIAQITTWLKQEPRRAPR